MSTAAFWHCLVISAILAIAAPVSCLKCISCRCGSTSENYTQCNENELQEEYMCNTWAKCQTCKDNTTHCITCPPKQFGPLCTEGVLEQIRRKRLIHPSIYCKNDAYIHNGRVFVLRTLTRPLLFEEDDFELPFGTRLHYSCDEGYVLKGVAVLICEENGYWSEEEQPTCVKDQNSCRHPGLKPNSKLITYVRRDEILPPTTQLTYICNKGYETSDPLIISCLISGQWSSPPPACNRNARTSVLEHIRRKRQNLRMGIRNWETHSTVTRVEHDSDSRAVRADLQRALQKESPRHPHLSHHSRNVLRRS